MKKYLGTFSFVIILTLLFTACTNPIQFQTKPLSTPMNAAKAFVAALTSGNINQLDRVVYPGQSIPTNEIMSIAKLRKIIGMNTTQFTYQQDPFDENSINVSFKDKGSKADTWKLSFIKNEAGQYQYDGYASGTLFSNNTPTDLARSYAQILIHSTDKNWLDNIKYAKSPGNSDNTFEMEMEYDYHLNNKKISDFSFNKIWYVYTGDYDCTINLNFKDNSGKVHADQLNLTKRNDGYYLNSSSGVDTGIDLPKIKIKTKTLSGATYSFLLSEFHAALQPDQLVADKRDELGPDLLKIAELSGFNERDNEISTSYEIDKKRKDTVNVTLNESSRGSDQWRLVFDQTKKGHYQFDAEKSGTLMQNTTLNQLAKSYIWAILYGQDSYWVNSLTLPDKRGNGNYDSLVNEVAKYNLTDKDITDFNITTHNNSVVIKFKDSKGNKQEINLSAKEVKDGYYITSQGFS